MADTERLLLAKVLRDRDMPGLIEARVDDERFFVDDEHRAVLAWMQDHWREYGTSPGVAALAADRPNYELPPTPEPLAYYVSRIRLAYKYDVTATAVQEASSYLEDRDADNAILGLTSALNDVSTIVSPLKDHNLTDPEAFDRLFTFYGDLTKNPGALRGYSTGWETLDLATMGLQPGQLITFVGPPKGGKSTVLLSCADNVNRDGHRVLLVSFEMSYDEQVARWVGIRGRLNYRRLLKGRMNEADENRMNRILKQLREGEESFILSEDISSTTTVSGIIAKIQQHRPAALFIDGVYLMDDENGEPKGSSAALTNITRSLKRVAQLFDIPVVGTTQTLYSKMRGQSVKASSIGYTSSFGQDSDTVIAIEPRENDHGEKEHWLKVLLSRSGPQVEVEIDFDWATSSFTEIGRPPADDEDDVEYKDSDDEDDEVIR